MKVQEMTMWWILCGVLVVVGLFGAVAESESRVSEGGFLGLVV